MSGNFSRGNAEINDVNVSGGFGVSTTENTSAWVLIGLNTLSSGSEVIQSASFSHLRFNYELADRVTMNLFGQVQSNSILAIEYRELFGVNLDYDLDNSESNTMALGLFRELEKYSDASNALVWRLNVVGTTELEINTTKIVGYVYYQPNAIRFSDYRLIGEFSAQVPLTKSIKVIMNLASRFDSSPISSVGKWDTATTVGLRLNFSKSKPN